MSDPKWATDIANKKSSISYESWSGGETFSTTGSSTTSTSAVGAKRETIYGHTNRNHIWTPGTFTGAISFVKNLLSSAMFDVLGLFVGGKNETIHNCDSSKIFGSKKRIRVGYKYKIPKLNLFPLGQAIGEMPWREESFSFGDRTDTVKGDILTTVVNGEEKKIYNNTKSSLKENLKTVAKVLGFPFNWEGLTYSSTNAATGYSFTTDKNYYVYARGGKDAQCISFQTSSNNNLQASYFTLRSNEDSTKIMISTEAFESYALETIERTVGKRSIFSNETNISSKQSLNLGVSRSTIRITNGNVVVAGSVDLGKPDPGIEVDDEERLAREERERLEREAEQERLRLEEENRQHEAMAEFLQRLGE